MAKTLIQNTFKNEQVEYVQARTLAAENELGSVLIKCRMKKMEEPGDPEEGKIWS